MNDIKDKNLVTYALGAAALGAAALGGLYLYMEGGAKQEQQPAPVAAAASIMDPLPMFENAPPTSSGRKRLPTMVYADGSRSHSEFVSRSSVGSSFADMSAAEPAADFGDIQLGGRSRSRGKMFVSQEGDRSIESMFGKRLIPATADEFQPHDLLPSDEGLEELDDRTREAVSMAPHKRWKENTFYRNPADESRNDRKKTGQIWLGGGYMPRIKEPGKTPFGAHGGDSVFVGGYGGQVDPLRGNSVPMGMEDYILPDEEGYDESEY